MGLHKILWDFGVVCLSSPRKLDTARYHTLILIRKIKHKIRADGEAKNYLDEIQNEVGAFKKVPLNASKSLIKDEEALQHSAYLYFLTKQVVAIYESKINLLPLQVFNEMRNSLDHHFRSLIIIEENVDSQIEYSLSQIKKSEGHLQRALLDVIKLTCAAIVDNIRIKNKNFGEKAIMLADSGDTYKNLMAAINAAEAKLVDAKRIEYSLGNNHSDDINVCDHYLEALAAHIILDNFYKDNIKNLYWAKAKIIALNTKTLTLTILGGFFAGYLVRVFWAASENLPLVNGLIEKLKSFLSLLS